MCGYMYTDYTHTHTHTHICLQTLILDVMWGLEMESSPGANSGIFTLLKCLSYVPFK